MADNDPPCVLSIQSHVVHGVVGNKAATLPLQLRGFEVDPMNVVQFSNHTGYGMPKGPRLAPTDVNDLVAGLAMHDLLNRYSYVLTGYVGRADVLREVAECVRAVRAARPDAVFVCDPVCGDNGRLYVAADVPDVYRDVLLPMANVATPNGFEAATLSGIALTSKASAVACCAWFHDRGVADVYITSFAAEETPKGHISIMASRRTATERTVACLDVPEVPGKFSGTGDLFSSIVVANHHDAGEFVSSFEAAVSVMAHVMGKTAGKAARRREAEVARGGEDAPRQFTELTLVECIDVLRTNGAAMPTLKSVVLPVAA